MENAFILKVAISFIVAGVWISGATVLAEKVGSKKGGLISNLPTTILVALVFVALVQDAAFAAKATDAVPIGMTIDTVFLLIFILLLKTGLVAAVIVSLASWFGMAVLAVRMQFSNILLNIVFYFIFAIVAYLFLEYVLHIPAKGKSKKKTTPASLLTRAAFAGSVVAGTIVISKFAGTYWVGLFSTFPAVMLSSMVILTLTQGAGFARATGKVMILSSTNIIIYALGVSLTYPKLGVVWGTLISFLMAFGWIILLMPLVRKLSR